MSVRGPRRSDGHALLSFKKPRFNRSTLFSHLGSTDANDRIKQKLSRDKRSRIAENPPNDSLHQGSSSKDSRKRPELVFDFFADLTVHESRFPRTTNDWYLLATLIIHKPRESCKGQIRDGGASSSTFFFLLFVMSRFRVIAKGRKKFMFG